MRRQSKYQNLPYMPGKDGRRGHYPWTSVIRHLHNRRRYTSVTIRSVYYKWTTLLYWLPGPVLFWQPLVTEFQKCSFCSVKSVASKSTLPNFSKFSFAQRTNELPAARHSKRDALKRIVPREHMKRNDVAHCLHEKPSKVVGTVGQCLFIILSNIKKQLYSAVFNSNIYYRVLVWKKGTKPGIKTLQLIEKPFIRWIANVDQSCNTKTLPKTFR